MKFIFWAVDCQQDFINPDGKLYVKDAEKIKPTLKYLTDLAMGNNIQVVSTGDWHTKKDVELSDNPDFINTFPAHCIENSEGAEFIDETKPDDNSYKVIIDHDDIDNRVNEICNVENIIIRKNKFDVFAGNKNTEHVLEIIAPDVVIVTGVATNVCVDCAVRGLASRGYKVVVVMDAIKELPNLPVKPIYDVWDELGVMRTESKTIPTIVKLLEEDKYGN